MLQPSNASESFSIVFKEENLLNKYKEYDFSESFKETFEKNCLLFLKGSAFFEINQNGEIYYQCLREFKDYDFAKLLCNMPLPMFFVLNDQIAFHASAIRYKDNTILFSGKSGNGKSNAALEFLSKGSKLITEDIAIIDCDDHQVKVLPSYPIININTKDIRRYDDLNFDLLKCERTNSSKNPLITKNFNNFSECIDRIFFLEWAENDIVEELNQSSAYLNLIKNTWQSYPYFNSDHRTKKQLNNIDKIVKTTGCYLVKRCLKTTIQNKLSLPELLNSYIN